MKKWTLFAVMAVFVVTPVAFWASSLRGGLPLWVYLYATGRVLALLGFLFVFFQYVLSSKIRWIEKGIGLDQLINIHRTSGVIGLTIVLIHPSFLFLSDLVAGFAPAFPPAKLIGVLSLAIFVVGVGAALLFRRLKLRYETWKAAHWANYVALPLAFYHSLKLGSDLAGQPLRTFWIVLVVLYLAILAHKLWKRVQIRRRPFQVVDVRPETHDCCTLTFQGHPIDYKPGQFLIVQLIRDGQVSEPHPFTLSSSPTRAELSISVKAVGDFTSTIPQTKTSDLAYIDAPYGVFSFLNHDAENLVFIAGGIGITPFISMLRYIRDKQLDRRVVLIWGSKTESDIAFRKELVQMVDEMPRLEVVHVMSRQADWSGEKGYVTADLLRRVIGDVQEPQVFICGPPVMRDKVVQALRETGISKRQIHYERFALR